MSHISILSGSLPEYPCICVDNAYRNATYSAYGLTTPSSDPINVMSMETYNGVTFIMNSSEPAYMIASQPDSDGSGSLDEVPITYVACVVRSAVTFGLRLDAYRSSSWYEGNIQSIPPGLHAVVLLLPRNGSAPFNFSQIRAQIFADEGDEITIVNFKAGIHIEMPYALQTGFAPSALNPQDEMQSDWSVGGQILGTQLERSGVTETMNFSYLNPIWVDTHLRGLAQKLRTEAVYFAWYPSGRPFDVIYAALDGKINIQYDSSVTMSFSMTIKGPAHG